jgi:hypothetical protein
VLSKVRPRQFGGLFRSARDWPLVALGAGKTASPADKKYPGWFEDPKTHRLNFKWQHTVRAIIQMVFLRRHHSALPRSSEDEVRADRRTDLSTNLQTANHEL